MGTWHELPRAAFDLETTGRDPETARIVTASVLIVNGRHEVIHRRDWLVDPGVEIPAEASAIHGVTTAHARAEGADAATAVGEVGALLADLFQTMPVLAFNACYDFTVLAREAARHGVAPLAPAPVIDPYVIDKRVDRYRRGKRTLGHLCEFYGVPLDGAHTSGGDAAATVGVALAQAQRYPDELLIDPLALHDAQVGWAADQAAGLQEYLRRKDPAAAVDGSWPLRVPTAH